MNYRSFHFLFRSLIPAAIFLFAVSSYSLADSYLFSISHEKCVLNILDPSDASITAVKVVQLPGTLFSCDRFGNALATDPSTGDLWAVLSVRDEGLNRLAKFDPDTGLLTSIGPLGDYFAGIAFNADGSMLYGLTGYAADTPEMLYSLDKTNAAKSQTCSLSNGDYSEALAFSSTDNSFYHGSFVNQYPVSYPPVFEKITSFGPGECGVSDIGLSGDIQIEVFSSLGFAGSGTFYFATWEYLHTVTDAGAVNYIGEIDDGGSSKGLAVTPAILNFANLAITYTGCKRSRKSNLTERITVANPGATAATNAVLTLDPGTASTYVSDTLPAGLGCSSANGVLTCNLGTITSGQEITFEINSTVTIKRSTAFYHYMRVSSDEWETYANSANNFSYIAKKCGAKY